MKPKTNPFLRRFILSSSILIVACSTVSAADKFWDLAPTTGVWATAANWSTTSGADLPDPAAAPGTGDVAIFNNASSQLTIDVGTASNSAAKGSTTFASGAGAYIIGTSTAQIYLMATGSYTINMNSAAANDQTFNAKWQLGGSGSSADGSYNAVNNSTTNKLVFAGGVAAAAGGTKTVAISGAGAIDITGNITKAASGSVIVTKSGTGTLTLSGTNNYNGGLTLSGASAGQLNLNSASALGTGTFTINSGDLAKIDNTSGAPITLANNNPQTWTNNFTFVGTNDLNMGAGTITLSGGNRQVTTTAGTLTLGGVITDGAGTYGLTKAGTGTLVLSNANSYDGVTTVNDGVLRPTHADALGSTTGGTTAVGGSIELTNGLIPNTAEVLTISGSGAGFNGALRAGTGGGTWAGPIAIGTAGARLGATAGNILTITGTIANGASNTFAISGESGTGVVVINPTTSNTYTGKTDIVRGILRLGKTDALPTGTMLDVDALSNVADPAILDLAGFNQTAGGLRDGTTNNFSGKVTNSVAATTSVLTLNQTEVTFYEGTIENGAGTVELVKNGSGTLNLNRANTYTGPTSVNAGRLNIGLLSPAGITLTSPVTVASGAAIGGEGTSSTSITFGTGTSTLFFNPATAESLTAASVNTTGATVVVTPEGSVTTGDTYVVLTNSAGFSGLPTDYFKPSSRGSLAFGGTSNTELQFTAADPVTTLTWKGNTASPTLWDINTTANWNNGTGADKFFDFDSVAFDDSATNTTIVIQPASVNVGGMDFNNPTKPYSISGGGITGSATLIKSGAASLTLSNANSFTGGTTLNAGALNINNASALGAAAGQFIIAGGSIDNTSGVPVTTVNYPLTIDADINFTGTNDLNLGAGAATLGSNPGTARTITTTAGTLRIGGAITDGSEAIGINKAGNGTLTLAGASSYSGPTTVSAGTLKLGASGTSASSCPLGTTAAGTSVSSGATLDFGGFRAYAETITIAGTGVGGNGALVNSGGDQTNAVETLILSANSSIGGNGGRFDVRTNSVPATLNLANLTLTKSGSSYVALVGTAVTPGTGHIDITGGTLSIQTTTDMGGSASNTITVRNGATLDCYQGGTWTNPIWSVLMDAGSNFTNSNGTVAWDSTVTLNGAANLGGGSTLTLNGVVSGASGALTKTGAGTLNLNGTAANTYGGPTTVSAGTLALGKSAGINAVPGSITIDAGGVSLQADDQIPNASTVTLTTATSKFNINSKSETIANLDMQNASNTTAQGLVTGGSPGGKLTITGTLTHTLGNITLNSSGPGNSSIIDANTVINNGGSWVFGTTDGTQKLIVGSGGLTIGGGSTIAVGASVAAANFISLGGNVTSTAATTTNTISGAGSLNLNASRTFTVADDTPASDLTVSTIIADGTGTGALVKEGAGTMTCSAANTYSGNTTVNAGTLSLGNGSVNSSLANTADVSVASGATLNLNYSGTDTIDELTINGIAKSPGIWGSASSGAPNTDPQLTGTGTLNVTTGPSSSAYDTWASGFSLTGPNAAFDFDYDNDGLDNGLEWILGGNPTTSSTSKAPVASRNLAGDLVLTFTREENSITESTLKVLIGTNLATWPKEATVGATGSGPDANGVTVNINTAATPDAVTVTIPASNAASGKLFGRLKATRP